MQASIIKPHTPESVAEIITAAAKIVVEAELYDDLQPIAFTEAIRLLGTSVVIPTPTAQVPLGLALTRHAS